MTLRTYSVLLSALMLACGAPSANEPGPIPPVHLFTYPVGPGPDAISDEPPGSEGAGIWWGFAAIGAGGELYLYDSACNNIKVLDSRNGTLIRIVDGPPKDGPEGLRRLGAPRDLTARTDGTVLLLLDEGGVPGGGHIRFLTWSPQEKNWTVLGSLSKSALGIRRNADAWCQLTVGPDGTIYAYLHARNRSIPLPGSPDDFDGERLARSLDAAPKGKVGDDGRFYSTAPGRPGGLLAESAPDEGISVWDRNGALIESYPQVKIPIVGVRSDGIMIAAAEVLKWVRPTGEVVATSEYLPGGRCIKEISGPNSFVVAPNGEPYAFCLSKAGLEVYALGREAANVE